MPGRAGTTTLEAGIQPLVVGQTRRNVITLFQRLSTAGFAATAIGFGPGRIGFGLFVPEFRSAFSMSSSAVGFMSSLGFLGFFIGLLIAQALLKRQGPAAPVLSGLLAATLGMGVVALAPDLTVLAIGVFLTASSAGFAWTPFNDAVHRKVSDLDRPTALSRISTGASVGVAAAGLAALAMVLTGLSWRFCWALFAICAGTALIANQAALRNVEKNPEASPQQPWHSVLHVGALPLFAIAFVYGTTSAFYISFAADHMQASGGVPGVPISATPALIFIVFGLFGLTGLFAGRVKQVVGLLWILRLVMLAAALSVALAAILPGSWAGLTLSAGLQGLHVMMTSAVLAFWAERLFPSLPSFGFTAALLATAAGSIVGPAVAGIAADAFGTGVVFLGAATLPAATALLLRERHARERPLKATPF